MLQVSRQNTKTNSFEHRRGACRKEDEPSIRLFEAKHFHDSANEQRRISLASLDLPRRDGCQPDESLAEVQGVHVRAKYAVRALEDVPRAAVVMRGVFVRSSKISETASFAQCIVAEREEFGHLVLERAASAPDTVESLHPMLGASIEHDLRPRPCMSDFIVVESTINLQRLESL